jgi:hypothetical protein
MSDRPNYNRLAPTAMKALGGVHVYLHSHADLQWLCIAVYAERWHQPQLWNSAAPIYAKALDHARSLRFRDQP